MTLTKSFQVFRPPSIFLTAIYCFLHINAVSLPGQASLPFYEDFEDSVLGIEWSVDQSDYSYFTDVDPLISAYLELFDADTRPKISLDIEQQSSPQIVFIDMMLKPSVVTAVDELPLDLNNQSAVIGAVLEEGDGVIYAFDGDEFGGGNWIALERLFALDGTQFVDWIRYTLRLDYGSKTFDVFIDGELLAFDIGFADPSLMGISRFLLSSGANEPTGFDSFRIQSANPLFPDADGDGMSDAYEIASALNLNVEDRSDDFDRDGFSNLEEFVLGTRADLADTDGDGLPDRVELMRSNDPLTAESRMVFSAPFFEDFEGYIPGTDISDQDGWSDSGGGSAQVSTDAAWMSDQSLRFASAMNDLEFSFGSLFSLPDADEVRIDFNLKPVVFDASEPDPELSPETASAFYVTNAGELRAYDGSLNGWSTVASGIDSEGWMHFSLRQDYVAQTWDLYLNEIQVVSGYGFAHTVPYFYQLRFGTGAINPSYLDNISVEIITTSGDDIDDVWKQQIVDADPLDAITTIEDVLPEDDFDADGLSNLDEFNAGTSPLLVDSDGDGLPDAAEFFRFSDPATPDAYSFSPIPFFDDFEGYGAGDAISGQNGWNASGNGSAEISSEAAWLGGQGLQITSATNEDSFSLGNLFSLPTETEIWIDFSLNAVPFASSMGEPLISRETASAFYMNKAGELRAYDGLSSNWATVATDLDPSAWQRFTLRHDYAAQVWDLYVDDVQVITACGFAHNVPYFYQLRFGTGAVIPTYLDNISINTSRPDRGLDLDGDGMDDAWEQQIVDADLGDTLLGIEDVLPGDNFDGGTANNLEEFLRGTSPLDGADDSITIYVDGATGSDANDGLIATNLGNGQGPKQTIGAALVVALTNDAIQVTAGGYQEALIDVAGRDIRLLPSGTVTLDLP